MEKSIQKVLIFPFLVAIAIYRFAISPWLPFACRYQPTCSEYAKEALQRHGVIRGLYLTIHRILRCHPWGGSGYNPVPPAALGSKCCSQANDNNRSSHTH